MTKYLSLLILTAGLCSPKNLPAAASRKRLELRCEATHNLPVGRGHFFLAIPSTYKTAFQHDSDKCTLYEYIPTSESTTLWTEVIDVHVLRSSHNGYDAESVAQAILSGMFDKFHPIKIHTESNISLPNGNQRYQAWATYKNASTNGQELIYIAYEAGGSDCVGWFYTFKAKNSHTNIDLTAAHEKVSKILAFSIAENARRPSDLPTTSISTKK